MSEMQIVQLAAEAADMLPVAPGSYILILRADQAATISVGRLGDVPIVPGWYLYTGSALGTGGLHGRVRHHLRPVTRPHWHIDYLRHGVHGRGDLV
jgi:Uri superfamily endonuclease